MDGAIVINGYLNGSSFTEPAEMLTASAAKAGVGMRTFLNNDLTVPIGDAEAFSRILGDTDFVIFWDKDVPLAKNLEVCDIPVFNCSECIRLCDDKVLTHLTLADWNIPSIRTVASPMSFGMNYEDQADRILNQFGFPFVSKDRVGSFGQQVRLVRDMGDLRKELSSSVPKIFQEYIECGGEDIRVEVVGGRVVAAVKRKAPEGDFRSNASNGGVMKAYSPTEEEKSLAIEAANAVEADFCGVDIISSEEGPKVCEINSNAHITNLRNATGIDVSERILQHVINYLS